MASCELYLQNLLRCIEPTKTQKAGAVRSHNYLRDILNTGQMANRIIATYLSGSYKRNTAVRPLDDVDIIVLIDPSYWRISPFASFFLGIPPLSADKVLRSFADAIRYRYSDSPVFTQRRSVRLQLYHLDIDIVPAIQDEKRSDYLYIPDVSAQKWIPTSPKRHALNAISVNKSRGGKFKPLVKLLKQWNYNLPSTTRLKSFAIETMAVRVFQNQNFSTLQEGLFLFFDFIAYVSDNKTHLKWNSGNGVSLRWLNCKIPDTAGTSSNISAGVDDNQRRKFIQCAIRSRDKMAESFNATTAEISYNRTREALRF